MHTKSSTRQIETIVCIPARDEAERIVACLDALAAQKDRGGRPIDLTYVTVLLLVNNSKDDTAARAMGWSLDHLLRLEVRCCDLPPHRAHAGGARRSVMDWGTELLAGREGILCSTDADSRVATTWLADLWSIFHGGVDAVAGTVAFESGESPLAFSDARRLEDRYAALQAEVAARLDPEPHNPWPNHVWAWGANFSVTAAAYRAVGGLPEQALAEDRALASTLRRHDFRIRHALDVRVTTSCRDQGRAPGGLAELVRCYAADDDYPCDAELEHILAVAARASAKKRLRRLRKGKESAASMARQLGVSLGLVEMAARQARFGEGWFMLEAASPRLARARLRPKQLPLEIARAEQLLRRLRPATTVEAETTGEPALGLWSIDGQPA